MKESGLTQADMACTVATGYGRQTYDGADYQVSELTCHALGVHYVCPGARTVIDIGGQDAKVLSLNEEGRMINFVMNDKCAAGTGRFLDVMANIRSRKSSKAGKHLQHLHGIRRVRGNFPAGIRN